ncbi:MAG: sensor histidine kinase [Bryobacteraceae bacterium]|nr:sensor histidine kinase [Bryobacteraceae bacterium]
MPKFGAPYDSVHIEKSLIQVAGLTGRSAGALERQFRTRLASSGFTPEQRRAFIAVTPVAASRFLSTGGTPREYFAEVRNAGRTLALLNTPRASVILALSDYEEFSRSVFSTADRAVGSELSRARCHLHCALILLVNEAYSGVLEAESRLLEELLSAEHGAVDSDALNRSFLRSILSHVEGMAAALFHKNQQGLRLLSRTDSPAGKQKNFTDLPCLRHHSRAFSVSNSVNTSGILLDQWRTRSETVWSIPSGSAVLQIAFNKASKLYPRHLEFLRGILTRCSSVAARLNREIWLRGLSLRMLEVEELERRRLARELHDDAGQSLVVVRLQIELLEMSLTAGSSDASFATALASLAEIRTLTEETIFGVRRLISDLSPAVLEQLGLGAALRQLTNRFRSNYPVPVRLHLGPLPDLNPRLKIVAYRVLQECFTNISLHSRAKNVNVSVTSTDNMLKLSVEDDGVGFVVEEGLKLKNRFGLLGIRERVTLLNGKFSIQSTPRCGDQGPDKCGSGTKVIVTLPLTGEYPGRNSL